LWDVNDLFEYWQESPPTHVLVAAYLLGGGNKKQRGSGRPSRSQSLPGFSELTTAVNLAGGAVKGKLPENYRTAPMGKD